MEIPVARSRGRPRKRRREEEEGNQGGVKDVGENNRSLEGNGGREYVKNVSPRKRGRPPKKRAVGIKGEAMLGRYVLKEFEGSGVYLGKIVRYDSGLYRVEYEDGDREDLDSGELQDFLIGDEKQKLGAGDLLERKFKLDAAIDKKNIAAVNNEGIKGGKSHIEANKGVKLFDEPKMEATVELVFALENVDVAKSMDWIPNTGIVENEVPTSSELHNMAKLDDNHDDDDEDYVDDEDDDSEVSSGFSLEYGKGWETRAETEIPAVPSPELPPSSGSIGLAEEYVPRFFSVYGFLRTFSVRLFLSPFTLDDLVGCLKCTVQNTLLDAIHVAVLRALKDRLEGLASEGSELASKCLRSIDWALVDNLTWPVYLVHYLMLMGHLNAREWKGLYTDVLRKEYWTLTVGTKLTILQILCDDALDTEVIREEIDTREESEVGIDSDGLQQNLSECEPRKMFPRSVKTSVVKDRVNVISEAGNCVSVSSKTVKSDDRSRDTEEDSEDGNRDECQLCGMEGVLICCDGCPSAYHTRCIGVNKLSIPEGKWFCPECTISKLGPPITVGTSLRGAEVFGVDSYAQLFLGTCNHLLVLKLSIEASAFVRYYNCNDIPKVISALISSQHHAVSYLGICQGISKYWELPLVFLPPLETSQASISLENISGSRLVPLCSYPSDEDGNQAALSTIGNGTFGSKIAENYVSDATVLGTEKSSPQAGITKISLSGQLETGPTSMMLPGVVPVEQNSSDMTSKPFDHTEPSRTTLPAHVGISSGIASWISGFSSIAGQKNGVCLSETSLIQVKGDINKVGGGAALRKNDTGLYMGSVFKPLAYINHYVHGDFAASAADNFNGLSSDENRASMVHASDPRKATAAAVALQVKAFSSAAVRFFWPSTEKKLIEIPRERCSWCLHCKAPIISRKACLLNQAALNATKAEMKFLSGLRLVKNVDSGLYGIAAYTLYMEESLRGLIIGPFRNSLYREQWRKQVEQAAMYSEMKYLLLDLERNLCTIAISSEWTKLVDYWMDESSIPQSAAVAGSTQKRGTGRRKKNITTPDVSADDSNDSNESSWWRGGKLGKLVFQRGTFPSSIIRKAARQVGNKRLPGIYYADALEVPKRSRQFIWRSAVEMAKTTAQLALQVRHLDKHIKWSDLVRPEQNPGDGKGPETEAFAFRNAQVCDKKIEENKIMYGVVFGHQKHLSTRLMKSIIEKEENTDGKDKYWLLEARIPLYLIKEFEENADETDLPPVVKLDRYTKHQKKQLRAARKEIAYLERRRDNMIRCPCASCHGDVLIEFAVSCGSCEGFCHKNCMISSTVSSNEDIEYRATCKKCLNGKSASHTNITVESPTSPLPIQGQEFQNSSAVAKSRKLKPSSQQYQSSASGTKSVRPKGGSQPDSRSDKKPTSTVSKSTKSKKRSLLHWGLVWKKKAEDDGSEFRDRNILFRGSSDGLSLSPQCHLCHKPYSPYLMYIRCDACENWYHADAVELDESKLPDLMGYKCCRCRRIRSPVCPHAESTGKKLEVKKLRIKGPKEEKLEANSASEAVSEQAESLPSTPMSLMEKEENGVIVVDDPLLVSVSQVEQLSEPKLEADFEWNAPSVPGPQKLPVRRYFKNERDDDGLNWNDIPAPQLHLSTETENIPNPNFNWGISSDLEDGAASNIETYNFESADYEPQTYFSFNELLDGDDGDENQMEGVGVPTNAWDGLPSDFPSSDFMEQCELESFGEPPVFTESAVDACCEVCQVAAPAPDLTCCSCGIQIHSQCSPWEDEIPEGSSWLCGQCRGWN